MESLDKFKNFPEDDSITEKVRKFGIGHMPENTLFSLEFSVDVLLK